MVKSVQGSIAVLLVPLNLNIPMAGVSVSHWLVDDAIPTELEDWSVRNGSTPNWRNTDQVLSSKVTDKVPRNPAKN